MTLTSAAAPTMLYLLDAEDEVDERLLRRWVDEHAPGAETLSLASGNGVLSDAIRRDGEQRIGAVRVAWLPPDRGGERTARLRDVALGNPYNPSRWRKRQMLRTNPDAARIVVAESALLSDLRARPAAPSTDDPAEVAAFVARQGTLALERAEYRLRGARYKVPRLVREQLLGSAAFRRRADELAERLGRE